MNLGQVLEDVEVVIRKEKIVKLNDWLRKEGKGGQIIFTAGVFSSGNYNNMTLGKYRLMELIIFLR
jgi:hypothetical protein